MENDPDDPAPRPQRKILGWFWRWFWRASLPISLCCVWYCFYAPKNDVAWTSHYASAQEQSMVSGKPMLLFFIVGHGSSSIKRRTLLTNVH